MGGYDYPYGYDFEMELAGGALGLFLIVYLLFLFVALAVALTAYILQSLSLYTTAKRRGIRKPWLAWIPIGSLWILGSIADQYQYVTKGKVKNRRKIMLGFGIAVCAMLPLMLIFGFIGGLLGTAGAVASAMLLAGLLELAMVGLAVALTVFQYISLYDMYCSCAPDNAVLYLVLSILFNVTMPIFMLVCCKKDGGMPPRKKAEIPAAPPAPSAQEEPEPEEGFARPEEFADME